MAKKVIRNIICAVLMCLMIGAFIYLGSKNYNQNNIPKNKETLATYYKSLDNNNVFKIYKNTEAAKFMDSGTGIILFCIKSSEWCDYYAAIVNEVAKELNIKEIYFFDILSDRDTNSYYYSKIITKTKDYLTKDDTGKVSLITPDIYVLNNGVILGHNNESSAVPAISTPKTYWNEESLNALKIELRNLFSKLEK